MTDGDHLSIGEVLGLLQDEFPDVTISKIRFLESQGLIDPERTPSGYRKFYEPDIDRLRWILTQQRENFLPLKVIKSRLEAAGGGVPEDVEPPNPRLPLGEDGTSAGTADATDATDGSPADPPPEPEAAPATVRASMPAGEAPGAPPERAEPIWMADVARQASAAAAVDRAVAAVPTGGPSPIDGDPSSVSLTVDELAAAAGLDVATIRDLEQFGLVEGQAMGTDTYYDGEALLIAQKAAGFIAHGIQARHLRMFKVAAEREAGFLEQVVMPLLKQRNPAAREQAVALLGELAGLGQELRGALLRSNLRGHLR